MNYSNIITNLAQASEKVQSWANQGFVPSIEKASVLEVIRKIYDDLSGDTITTEQIKVTDNVNESKTENIDFSSINNSIENACISIKEYIKQNQQELINEMSAFKDIISSSNIKAETITEEEPIKEEDKKEPVSNIKVDINPPIMGFYSLPENLRTNIINDLFDGDVARSEMAVNKMCSLKSVEELLIYIEEHYSWNPESSAAIDLIGYLSKKF